MKAYKVRGLNDWVIIGAKIKARQTIYVHISVNTHQNRHFRQIITVWFRFTMLVNSMTCFIYYCREYNYHILNKQHNSLYTSCYIYWHIFIWSRKKSLSPKIHCHELNYTYLMATYQCELCLICIYFHSYSD